jgi:hypothetical protein
VNTVRIDAAVGTDLVNEGHQDVAQFGSAHRSGRLQSRFAQARRLSHSSTLNPRIDPHRCRQAKGTIVATFFAQLVFDSAVLFAFSIPLILVARHHGRSALARSFLIAGAIVALLSTTVLVSSEQLVEMCFNAGNPGCQDFGSAGFRILLMGGYIVVALIEASLIARN